MGRSVRGPELQSHLRSLRTARGLSQRTLAERTGLTRQAVGAIESGHYIPNTAVALRLARVLECDVEALFSLSPDVTDVVVQLGSMSPAPRRLAMARVGHRWVGYPLAQQHEVQVGFAKADAVTEGGSRNPHLEVLAPPQQLEQTAVVFGCDPSLGIVGAHLSSLRGHARLLWISAPSQAALDALGRGDAHIAGTHLHELPEDEFNLTHARAALREEGGLVVEFARWEQGLVVASGNPQRIRTIADLADPRVRVVNREPGSGTRALLDELLARARIPSRAIQGYERQVDSHLAAAMAVASGAADGAISLRAMAQALELDFIPLEQVRFDFVIPRSHVSHPTVDRLLELLQGRALRAEIGALAGYDVARMGEVRADLPAA